MKKLCNIIRYWILPFLAIFLWPELAHAWGPTVHAHLAMATLANLGLFAPGLKKLLERFPNDFIYGNLSADIILGKKFIDYYYHCHNWRVGLQVLDHAKTDSQRAFAYGYLCHLAADVVAHNLFIPDKLVRAHHTLAAKHVYWEVRYDQRLDPKLLHQAFRIAKNYHQRNDPLLEEVLVETLFSFKTNKKIFNGLMVFQKHIHIQKLFQNIAKKSPLNLHEERANRYLALAQKCINDMLIDLSKSDPFLADASGQQKLATAKEIRKRIKKSKIDKSLTDKDIENIINKFHEILNETLFSPNDCPPPKQIIELA